MSVCQECSPCFCPPPPPLSHHCAVGALHSLPVLFRPFKSPPPSFSTQLPELASQSQTQIVFSLSSEALRGSLLPLDFLSSALDPPQPGFPCLFCLRSHRTPATVDLGPLLRLRDLSRLFSLSRTLPSGPTWWIPGLSRSGSNVTSSVTVPQPGHNWPFSLWGMCHFALGPGAERGSGTGEVLGALLLDDHAATK